MANSIDWIWPENPNNVNLTCLPLSDPLCANDTCLVFKDAHVASQARITYASQFLYGRWVSYYYVALTGIAMVIYVVGLIEGRKVVRTAGRAMREERPGTVQKMVALWRMLAYRRVRGRVGNYLALPSFRVCALILISFVRAAVASFAEHPYYRGSRGYGSPPLGVRAGLAGIAMTPITIALSAERSAPLLRVPLSVLRIGIVHTVPFIVNDLASGDTRRLWYQFYYPESYEYTGIAPFAILVFLCTFTVRWVRRRYYELFVHSHILAALAYLGAIFWHAGNERDSWYYLYATAGVWVVQLYARFQDKMGAFEQNRNGYAHVELLDTESGEATMIGLTIATAMSWAPGQHTFVRIPSLGLLDNHPFTIASVPQDLPTAASKMVFLVRPYTGFTQRLLQHVEARRGKRDERKPNMQGQTQVSAKECLQVFIDGPYGGLPHFHSLQHQFDHVVLVCGGGGISAMLPWAQHLSSMLSDVETSLRLQKISLVWCVRHRSAASWCEDQLLVLVNQSRERMRVDIHVTADRQMDASYFDLEDTEETLSLLEIGTSSDERVGDMCKQHGGNSSLALKTKRSGLRFHTGRPDLCTTLHGLIVERKTQVIGCGPESMKIDLSNAVARLQRRILKSEAVEVALHTETFGW